MKYFSPSLFVFIFVFISSSHCADSPTSPVSLPSKYSQDFNSLPYNAKEGTIATFVQGATLPGWWANQGSIIVSDGSSNPGGLYSFGETSSTDRALGAITSNSKKLIIFGVSFTSNHIVKDITVSFIGEQWRNGGDVPDTSLLQFDWSIMDKEQYANGGWGQAGDTKLWTPGLSFAGNTSNNNHSGPVRYRQPYTYAIKAPSMAIGNILQLRWTSHNGHDGLAIDDLLVEATLLPNTDSSDAIPPQGGDVTKIVIYVLAGLLGLCLASLVFVTIKWRRSVNAHMYSSLANGDGGGDGGGGNQNPIPSGDLGPYINRVIIHKFGNNNNDNEGVRQPLMGTQPIRT